MLCAVLLMPLKEAMRLAPCAPVAIYVIARYRVAFYVAGDDEALRNFFMCARSKHD